MVDVLAERQKPELVVFVECDRGDDLTVIIRVRDWLKMIGIDLPEQMFPQARGPDTAFEVSANGDSLSGLRECPGLAVEEDFGQRHRPATNPDVLVVANRDGDLMFAGWGGCQLRGQVSPKRIQ